jgi:glutathionylspermidine amidase/synthetase
MNIRKINKNEMELNPLSGRFGIKKQCVEFARRWLHQHLGLTFTDVRVAADIWGKIHYYSNENGDENYPIINIPNGSRSLPRKGELLIYSKKFCTTGHVSVVVEVNKRQKIVRVHEQNFENIYQSPYQHRCISFVNHNDRYWLQDNYLLGWKRCNQV